MSEVYEYIVEYVVHSFIQIFALCKKNYEANKLQIILHTVPRGRKVHIRYTPQLEVTWL